MNNLSKNLREYAKSGNYPFHMPGHKRQLPGAYQYDITEIEGFDDLNDPTGIIDEMNKDIAAHYGSKVSFFMVNGSTCGNLSAISAAADMNDTIIVADNCHRSVTNAAYLRKLNVKYITPKMYNEVIVGAVTLTQIKEAVEGLLKQNVKPKAVVITSPTYDGVVSPIYDISRYLHSLDIILIVDSAHGAHMHFDGAFPNDEIEHIDICIMSAHKTLPVLNQGSMVHINSSLVDPKEVMRFINIYQTSSPSYVIMESMSNSLEIIDEKKMFSDFVENLRRFYKETSHLQALSVEGWSNDRDMSKIIIYTNGYMTGNELGRILRDRYSLEMELYKEEYVLGMTSIMDRREAFDRLSRALKEIDCV